MSTYFVDAGLTYEGDPVTTLTGLWHLEGQTVQILADGAVETEQVVTDGAIVLPVAASVVHVGLAYRSYIRTLPLVFDGAAASGQGTYKNVRHVYLRVYRSSQAKIGPTLDRLVEHRGRSAETAYDTAPPLANEEMSVGVQPSWNPDGAVYVVQDLPLPLTVTAMALDVAAGG